MIEWIKALFTKPIAQLTLIDLGAVWLMIAIVSLVFVAITDKDR